MVCASVIVIDLAIKCVVTTQRVDIALGDDLDIITEGLAQALMLHQTTFHIGSYRKYPRDQQL